MKLLGNILWLIFGGLLWAIVLFIGGLLSLITIIGIPLGIQLFKMAEFVLWPFGKEVVRESVTNFKLILNVFWAIFFGWEIAVGYFITGAIFCITIIGIPFGKQYFKLSKFVLFPLGVEFKQIK